MDKKGVTPLIATFLLIAFAISLGAVVMSWGNSYVDDGSGTSDKDKTCASAELAFSEGNVCYDLTNKVVGFKIKNTGDRKIVGLKVTVFGNTGSFNGDIKLDPSLDAGAETTKTLQYTESSVGSSVATIRIVPIISDDLQGKLCVDKPIEISDIKECK